MKRLQIIVSLLLGLLLVAQVHAGNDTRQLSLEEGSAKRVALVIGNDSYQHVAPLKNAVSDARAIAAALQKAGFSVTFKANTDLAAMKQAVRQFKGNLSGGDEAIFYYSGHGVQLGNANYLLPVDITSDSEEQVKDDAIPLQRLLDDLQDQKVKFALAIIDACRDNPFKGAGRNIGTRGLAPTSAANGQMVIFSAGAGQQALDKLGGSDHEENGVFTRVFLQEMQKPNVEVHQVLRNVRTRVVQMAKSINHDQMPALYDQVEGDFYFYGSGMQVATLEPIPAPAPIHIKSKDEVEQESWESAKGSNEVDAVKEYLKQYPKGHFAGQANILIATLKKSTTKPAETTEPAQQQDAERQRQQAEAAKAAANGPAMIAIPGRNYEMGKYDVTQGEWKAVMGSNPSHFSSCGDNCPVEKVSWGDIQIFLQRLNANTGKQYRLPNETEWEYACYGGSNTEYCGGNDINAVAWYSGNSGSETHLSRSSGRETHPVGQKQANGYGLYDMSGNVYQWMENCYDSSCLGRAVRGSSWNSGPNYVEFRHGIAPTIRNYNNGFRLARTLP